MKNFFKATVLLLVLASVVCLFFGCGTGDHALPDDASGYQSKVSEDYSETLASSKADDTQKYVITSEFSCETKKFDEDSDKLKAKVDELGGYFENTYVSGKDYETYTTKRTEAKIRIPKDKFETFCVYIRETFEVVSENTSKENITESYYSAQSHYETLKVSEERLLELLKQANNLDEIIMLEKQLAEVRQQIQYYDTILKSYDNQVDYATVSVSIHSVAEYTDPGSESFFSKIKNAFVNSWKDFAVGCGDFAVFFVECFPTLLILGVIALVIVLIIKLSIRHNRKKKARRQSQSMPNSVK